MAVRRTNFKVLVVDDHFMARQIVGNVLQKCNVTDLKMVADGSEAIAAITTAHEARTPFHIVFLDWEMPGVSGLEVLNYFRSRREYNATAFVMLTALAQQADVMQAVRAGATSYITKPVSRSRIEEKFADICEWVRKQEAASS